MRWLVRALASLVVLLLLLGIMVVLMPKDRVLALAADRFAAATGRHLTIGSGAKVTIWPVLGVSAGPVRLANADWGTAPDMLLAERIDIGLDPVALLDGRLHVTEIELAAPQLLLERAADGRVNWLMQAPQSGAAPAETAEATEGGTAFSLGGLRLRDGQIRYLNHGTGHDLQLTGIDLATALPDLNGPITLTVNALMRGQPLTLRADLGVLSDALAGRMTDLAFQVEAGGNRIGFSGRAGLAPQMAEGAIEVNLPDRPALVALAGRDLPDLPQGFGAESLTMEAGATLTREGSLHLRGAEIGLDGRSLAAELDWFPGPQRPRLVARLTTETLTLPLPGGDGAAPEAAPAEGWPTTALDVSALSALDAEIALAAENLQIGPAHLGPTRARLTLDAARAVLTLTRVESWGGTTEGLLVLNARKGLSASADLTLSGLDLQAALSDITGTARLAGLASGRVKLLAVGPSVDAMMRSLKGEVALEAGRGEIVGLDIAGMLRTMDPGYVGTGRRTVFDSLKISGKVEGGVLRSEDLTMAGDLFTSRGIGSVDLGARAVDYRLLPRLGKADGAGAEVPVLIKGPWSAPRVRLDLEWLASERAKAEAARAEDLAKQRLEALAQEKLGVARQQGETLEDAAKRRAREAVEAETGRILDRLLQGN